MGGVVKPSSNPPWSVEVVFGRDTRRPMEIFRADGDIIGGVVVCLGEGMGNGWGVFMGGCRGEEANVMGEGCGDGDVKGDRITL